MIEGEKVFGVRVTKGKVNTGDTVDVYREGQKTGTTRLVSLRSRAKTVQEAKKDQEAGMLFDPKLDIKVGDVVKFIP
jgi:translation initiation factor IF-2